MEHQFQWFPGHMAKAKREIIEQIKLVDIVIELLDARIPLSSRNPLVNEIVGKKERVVLLNKASLADKTKTKAFIDYFASQNIKALDIDSITKYNLNKIKPILNSVLEEKKNKDASKGIIRDSIRCLIIGIPNVGKSTLINTLCHRHAAVTGNKPGVTKKLSWIKTDDGLLFLDTPGILWPKFESQEVGMNLALCGSIKDEILDLESLGFYAINFLQKKYPNSLVKTYKIDDPSQMEIEELLDNIGRKRGLLMKGNVIDYDRLYKMVINDIRQNKLGGITIDE